MGNVEGSPAREQPQRRIYLDGYLIAAVPITQKVWLRIMGNNPARFAKGDNYPVEQISWEELQRLPHRLTCKFQLKLNGNGPAVATPILLTIGANKWTGATAGITKIVAR